MDFLSITPRRDDENRDIVVLGLDNDAEFCRDNPPPQDCDYTIEATHKKHSLGPVFLVSYRKGKTNIAGVAPVSWIHYLETLPPERRAYMIRVWQDYIRDNPSLLLQTAISQTDAAQILGISSPAFKKRYCDEYLIRWVKLFHDESSSPTRNVSSKARARDAVLVSVADVLTLAAERLQAKKHVRDQDAGTAHMECENPDCGFEVTAGTTCPKCRCADLVSS